MRKNKGYCKLENRRNVRSIAGKMIQMLLVFAMAVSLFVPADVAKAETTPATVTIQEFATQIKDATEQDVLKDSGISDTSKVLTVEVAAFLLETADYAMNGGVYSYDFDLYSHVNYYNRISDLSKAKKTYRKALQMCFTKGIIIGKSNGKYSQDRKLSPKAKVTVSAAKKYLTRLTDKSKRYKLSYDGQVIRTTNLPKNYKEYPYILASFPNSYYEKNMRFTKQREEGLYLTAKQVTEEDMCAEDRDLICDKVRENLELRLNVNYKKTFTSSWKTALANTYRNPEGMTADINNYVKKAKARKVVVESSKIVVEPSSLWFDQGTGSYYVRVYATFKVKSGNVPSAKSLKQNEVIFGDYVAMKNLPSHKTVTFCNELEVRVSGNPNNQRIYIYGLGVDYLNDYVVTN